MFDRLEVSVVIPARNEEERIGGVIEGLPAWVDHVVVVDDASTDLTAVRATEAADRAGTKRFEVSRHPSRRGVGAAIVTGYRRVLSEGTDVAVVMAGDGQMWPGDLPALLAPIVLDEADYTKGNRFAHPDVGRTMPKVRQAAGRVFSKMTGAAAGVPRLSDSQSGYTAIARHALWALDLGRVWPGYGYPNDLIGKLARVGMRVVDVPIRPVYAGEKSGLRPWHVAIVTALISRAAWERLRAS